MKAGFMCGLAKLRRKKIPNLFLGICILITAALFANALVLLRELNTIFDKAYEEMEGAQICCLWSNEIVSSDFVREYLEHSQEEFEYQITEDTKTIDYMKKDGVTLSNGILLELPERIGRDMLSPKISDASEPDMPGKGEVWITTKLARILQLKEGDEFFLQLADTSVKVKVAKIVIDPVFGSSNTNIYRMWCGFGQLADFPVAENDAVSYLEIRFDEYSLLSEQNFIRDAEEYFQMPFGNTLYTYDKIKSGYTAVYQMVGVVLCFVSVVLVITAAWLTLFLIKSDMDEDIRNIGIYKSLGMTGRQIIHGYLVSYGIISFAGAALGSIIGDWLSKRIITGILGDIGIYTVSFTGITGYAFFVCIVVLSAVLLIVFSAIFKIYRLNASYAIREGAWKTAGKGRKMRKRTCYNGRASFELYYAVRGIQNRKARYAYIAGVSLILSSLTIACTGCLNAVGNIDKEPEAWGFIKTDIYVTSLEDTPVSAVMDELEKAPEVDYTYGVNKVYVTYKPYNKGTYQSIMTELYELPWNEKIKDRSLYGRRPDKENEVGVGLGLAGEYGLGVGEKIELFVNGKRGEYEITEIFQTLSNSGNVLRMVTNNLDEFVKEDGTYGDYMLVLRNSSDKWEYAKELSEKYNGKFAFIASKSNGENFTGVLAPAVGTILTVLIIISVLITMNLTFLLIRREQNRIGLLKAAGMTSWQVLKIYVCRNCLSAMVGSCLGIVTGMFVIPPLLTPYAKLLGLTKFPFVSSLTGGCAGLVLPPACMLVGTVVIIKTIHSISVKQLVNE
ncbi:MAG: FtsX-like permease family protein [Lachnospiraceae bacterium]|nr:FtsX-like permease family protein [Lachnospiraceae bacterium]